ncbi:MAG: YciI family protein [Candidatus Binataceae bacterium]
MKFMLKMIDDEKTIAALTSAEIDKILATHGEFRRQLQDAGKWIDSRRLRPGNEATTIRRTRGKRAVLDGPFAETKEILGGFYLIEADSKADAIEWAKKLPYLDVGGVEVHPCRTGAQGHTPVRAANLYMTLFIVDSTKPMERDEVFRAIDRHYEVSLDLAAQGKFISSRALEPPSSASSIRWRNGAHVVTDGPFAETREYVGGFFVIACDTKDESLNWADQLSLGDTACEVRPVWPRP